MKLFFKCVICALLFACSYPSIAQGAIDLSESNTSSLDSLANTPRAFPSCNKYDNAWQAKLGPDTVKLESAKSGSLILEANQITGQANGEHYAEGNVIGYKDDKTMVADWLEYDQKKSHVTGGDHIVLTRQYDVITGKWVDYYMNLDQGEVKQASAFYGKTNMYSTGEQINIYDKKHFQIESGYLTTCDPKNPEWHIKAKEMNFDYQNSEGNARNTVFYVESTPVFAFPYLRFPLGQRKSGFLVPEVGGTSNVGIMLGTPYYWNMAPNYDMTIEPRIYSKSGFMVTDQFRYMTNTGGGEIYTEQMPNDWQNNQSRYYWHLLDQHNLMDDVNVGYSYNKVSDSNYFVDFGNFYSTVDNINLASSVYANYTPNWGLLGIKVQDYQVLSPTGQPQTSPIYGMTPQVNFNVNPIKLGASPFQVNLLSQYTDFTSGLLQTGQRAMIYPSLTMPLQNVWGYVKPKFGYSYTNYQLEPFQSTGSPYSVVNRQIPITSLDTGMVFERPIELHDNSYSQTLEPRLYYLYIPEVDQAQIPIFDTAPASYNIAQLFSENRFAGYDRINMANDLTGGLTTRLINDDTGVEVANYGVGYRYYITPEDNMAYGSYTQFQQLYLPEPNLIGEFGNNWGRGVTSNASIQYTTVYQQIDAYSLQLRYNPESYKVLNARYSYQFNQPLLYYSYIPGQQFTAAQYENQYALDLSGQWPIYTNRWLADGRVNYDFTKGQLLNLLTGLEYNGGCWSISAIYENYITNVTQTTNAYFFQISLTGVANIGSDPTNDLRMNIPGYAPITNIH